jgi:hypothetical protein
MSVTVPLTLRRRLRVAPPESLDLGRPPVLLDPKRPFFDIKDIEKHP